MLLGERRDRCHTAVLVTKQGMAPCSLEVIVPAPQCACTLQQGKERTCSACRTLISSKHWQVSIPHYSRELQVSWEIKLVNSKKKKKKSTGDELPFLIHCLGQALFIWLCYDLFIKHTSLIQKIVKKHSSHWWICWCHWPTNHVQIGFYRNIGSYHFCIWK